jgi:hypothetical protein
MQQPKIVLGFAYTRCRANSRYNFWKRSRLSEGKREKERVTPEFGVRKEEKILPQIQGVIVDGDDFFFLGSTRWRYWYVRGGGKATSEHAFAQANPWSCPARHGEAPPACPEAPTLMARELTTAQLLTSLGTSIPHRGGALAFYTWGEARGHAVPTTREHRPGRFGSACGSKGRRRHTL